MLMKKRTLQKRLVTGLTLLTLLAADGSAALAAANLPAPTAIVQFKKDASDANSACNSDHIESKNGVTVLEESRTQAQQVKLTEQQAIRSAQLVYPGAQLTSRGLEKSSTGYFYRVLVISTDGRILTLKINATTGEIKEEEEEDKQV